MSKPKACSLLGRLAVHNHLITMDQLAEVTSEQGRRRDGTNLGGLLVEMGCITDAQLKKLLRAQQEMLARQRAQQAAQQAAPSLEKTPSPKSTVPGSAPATPATPATPISSARPSAASDANAARGVTGNQAPVSTAQPVTASTEKQRPASSPERPAMESEPAAVPASAQMGTLVSASGEDREALVEILKAAVSQRASDIHIHAGAPLIQRVDGQLVVGKEGTLDADYTARLVVSVLTPKQRELFAEHGEIDFCYTLDGVGRFRANIFQQQRGVDGVFRHISPEPPSLEELGLPQSLAKFTNYHQGMVLVTGPAGCGKSSTMAALVDLINEERREHILTIEDPIEFLHSSKRCLVNQRSVHSHTESFARALRAALREDPDVIVIGELRDLETISLALSAAETGHFVLGTLHTNSAIRTLNRLIGAFPANQQAQIRMMISESLRAVISQRLIRRADGPGRVAALETLVVTRAIGNLIRENKTFQIQSILQTGASQGMGLLEDAVKALVAAGTVTPEEAALHCEG
jgi:twitching motility protein PilT